MKKLKLDKDFIKTLPPLSKEELQKLETDIINKGIIQPIIIWQSPGYKSYYIIDGHNRFNIAQKNKIKFNTKEIKLKSKEEVIIWIVEHQLARRNLSTFSKIEVALKLDKYYKSKAKENMKLSRGRGIKGLKKKIKPYDSNSRIAKQAGTNRSYINKVKYVLKQGTDKIINSCRNGNTSIQNGYFRSQDKERIRRRRKEIGKTVRYVNPKDVINNIHQADCIEYLKKNRKELKDKITLYVFSPPYNNNCNYGKNYNDNKSYNQYLMFLKKAFNEFYICCREGGRMAINIDSFANRFDRDSNNKSDNKHCIYADIVKIAKKVGWRFYFDIYWYKYNAAGKKFAFGSHCSPSLPQIRRDGEYILIFSKKIFKLENIEGTEPDITSDEFLKYTFSTWQVHPITQNSMAHPSPFSEDIPYRLIKLLSFPNDIVCDPFSGTGSTIIVARDLGRRFIGIEQNSNYCSMSKKRLKNNKAKFKMG